jgi:hypothetical protein
VAAPVRAALDDPLAAFTAEISAIEGAKASVHDEEVVLVPNQLLPNLSTGCLS